MRAPFTQEIAGSNPAGDISFTKSPWHRAVCLRRAAHRSPAARASWPNAAGRLIVELNKAMEGRAAATTADEYYLRPMAEAIKHWPSSLGGAANPPGRAMDTVHHASRSGGRAARDRRRYRICPASLAGVSSLLPSANAARPPDGVTMGYSTTSTQTPVDGPGVAVRWRSINVNAPRCDP